MNSRFDVNDITLGICDHQYTVRVPEKLKRAVDQLSPAQKKNLKENILVAMAEVCHRAAFNPAVFLED